MPPSVYSYPESSQVAAALGKHILSIQESSNSSQPFRVAVSGGSLINALRKALVEDSEIASQINWSNWAIYFSDERLVELDHADSNYGLLKRDLLDHIKGTEQPTVYTIDSSLLDNASAIAEKYQEVLHKNFNIKNDSSIPIFDLILLGCGPDGHTCSLFPGHSLLKEESKSVAFIEDSPKPPPRRITLTFPVVNNAKNVVFVAEGAGKAPILKIIFEQPEEGLPSSIVNTKAKGAVSWFVNDPAVEGVNVQKSLL
ncbi:6-phosphogluconolactonase [Nadsonia fulvescens var. elongata DSM 6958]|uniref:6-phosphogluconolactonase-like protein n=1 Tax=Nadsonia fulvescens var. elongata DSM 6958 TaxID=857566 RepID=A0A1E3PKL8_9ASCO|nr:6-phosphogluconolactonase [Nadsonia fulvescens var. elongata DSM 6958]